MSFLLKSATVILVAALVYGYFVSSAKQEAFEACDALARLGQQATSGTGGFSDPDRQMTILLCMELRGYQKKTNTGACEKYNVPSCFS